MATSEGAVCVCVPEIMTTRLSGVRRERGMRNGWCIPIEDNAHVSRWLLLDRINVNFGIY